MIYWGGDRIDYALERDEVRGIGSSEMVGSMVDMLISETLAWFLKKGQHPIKLNNNGIKITTPSQYLICYKQLAERLVRGLR